MDEDEFNELEPCELFVMTSGDSMQFSVKICPEKIMLQKIIEKCGGQLHAKAGGPNTIRLLPIGDRPTQDEVFASKYIYDCVRSQELCDLNKYRVNAKSLYTDDIDVMDILLGNFTWADCTRSGIKHSDVVSDISDIEDEYSSPTRKNKLKSGRREYSSGERKSIVNYIIENKRYTEVKAKNLWMDMEAANICPGRTWQSLKEHYRNNIVNNLNALGLPDKEIKKLSYKYTDEHLRGNVPLYLSSEDENLSPNKKISKSQEKTTHKNAKREIAVKSGIPKINKDSRVDNPELKDKSFKGKIIQDEHSENDRLIDINDEGLKTSPKKKVKNATDEVSDHNQSSEIQSENDVEQMTLPDISKISFDNEVIEDLIGDKSIFYTCQGEVSDNENNQSSSEYEEIPNSGSENEINPTDHYLKALNRIDSDAETVPFCSEIDSTQSQNVSEELEYPKVRSPRVKSQKGIKDVVSPRKIPNADVGTSSESEVEVKRHRQSRRRSGLTPKKSTINRNSFTEESPDVFRKKGEEKSLENNSCSDERNSEDDENEPNIKTKLQKKKRSRANLSSTEDSESDEDREEVALFLSNEALSIGDGNKDDDDDDDDDELDCNETIAASKGNEIGMTNTSHHNKSESDYGSDTEYEDTEDNEKSNTECTEIIKSQNHGSSKAVTTAVSMTNEAKKSHLDKSESEYEDDTEDEDIDIEENEKVNTEGIKIVKNPSSPSKFNRKIISSNYDNDTGLYDRTYNPKSGKRKKPNGASPNKKRRRESMQGHYNVYEDIGIIKYIYDREGIQEVRGNNLWIEMEKSGVIPGRSWLSLKERFRMRILRQLDSYLEQGLEQDIYDRFNEYKRVKEENPYEGEDLKPMRDKKYTHQDDIKILKYIEEKNAYDLVGGRKFWQDMVESDILYGRSWLSLKERYRRVIIRNLKAYTAYGFAIDQLKLFDPRYGPDQNVKIPRGPHTPYIHKEDQDILNFIVKNNGYSEVGGKTLWLKMSITEELKGRTWLSLKERYRRRIIHNLNNYDLTDDEKKKLINRTSMKGAKKSPRRIPKGPGYKTSRTKKQPQPSTSGYSSTKKQTNISDSSDDFVESNQEEDAKKSNLESSNKRNKFFKMYSHPKSPHLLIETPSNTDKQFKTRNLSLSNAKDTINKGRLKNNLDQSPTVDKKISSTANSPQSPKLVCSTNSKESKKDKFGVTANNRMYMENTDNNEVIRNLECFSLANDHPGSSGSSTISNLSNDLPDISLDIESQSDQEDAETGESNIENIENRIDIEDCNQEQNETIGSSNDNESILYETQNSDKMQEHFKNQSGNSEIIIGNSLHEESDSNFSSEIDKSEPRIYNLRKSPQKSNLQLLTRSPRENIKLSRNVDIFNEIQNNDKVQGSPTNQSETFEMISGNTLHEETKTYFSTKSDESEMGIYNLRKSPLKSNLQLLRKSPRTNMRLSRNIETIDSNTNKGSKEIDTLPNVINKLKRKDGCDFEENNQQEIDGEQEVSSADGSNKENETNPQAVNPKTGKSLSVNNEPAEMVESNEENDNLRRSRCISNFNLHDTSPRKKPKQTKDAVIINEKTVKGSGHNDNLNDSQIENLITPDNGPINIYKLGNNEKKISEPTNQIPSNITRTPSPQKAKTAVIYDSPHRNVLNNNESTSKVNKKTPKEIVTPIRKITNRQLNSLKKKTLNKSISPSRILKGLGKSQIVRNKLRKRARSKTK